MKTILTTIVAFFIISTSFGITTATYYHTTDFDPLVDIQVTVDILAIRGLEESVEDNEPNLQLNLEINNQRFSSNWPHQKYINNPEFSATVNVEDDNENVVIHMQLVDVSPDGNRVCDIGNNTKDVTILYNIKTGRWTGDDHIGDSSGYGRLNGCDDGSMYIDENDYELWFSITQTDPDGDNIPYWTEINVYQTDPKVDNSGEDKDQDSLPIEYEHYWGFDPFSFNDHQNLDSDNDSISNYEEFLTKQYHSDPFRKDIFLEIDWMEEGPNGEISEVPKRAVELLKNPFHRRNYVFHVDRGRENGGELIPFKQRSYQSDIQDLYNDYFLHNGKYQWRRGVFHWAVFVNEITPRGFAFSGDTPPYWGYIPGTNGFIVASRLMEDKNSSWKFKDKPLEYFYGSVIMHEMGHNFGIRNGNPGGCDNFFAKYPWQIQFWIYRTYYSIMNYQYTYYHFDYSDGSHGWNDFDDWSTIDLSYFEKPE